ncbi:MAG TPA: EamA family transporter [Opitutaceae bacterium]
MVRAKPALILVLLGFAAIYLIWGSTYLGIRVAVGTMPPYLMAGMRFTIAGVLLFGFLKLRGAPWPNRAQWKDQAIAGILMLLGGNADVTWAEQTTPSGLTTLILAASPFLVVIMDWARPNGSRPRLLVVIGMAVGIGGVALLLAPGSIPAGYRPPALSVCMLCFSSICWWSGSLYSKHSTSGTPLILASAMQMLCGSAAMLLVALALGQVRHLNVDAISRESWIAFTYLVIAGSLIAFPVYVWLLKHSSPAKVSTYAYVNPVIAVILGWAILNEPLNMRIITAAVIILGAVVIITIGKSGPAKNT